jgi:hypothetical protein
VGRLRRTLAFFSPRRRRWERFLRSLPLDPGNLPRPLLPPGERDVIICGCPRTGTTLLAAALFQPPQVVTVMEPWDGMRMAPAELFASLRQEIAATGRITRGRLDLPLLLRSGEVRWCQEGAGALLLTVAPGFLLGVKWPAFWRYLEMLGETKFLVCLRDPLEVIASFRDAGGRLTMGFNQETRFNRPMNDDLRAATRDAALRRVLLFEYIHTRVLPFLQRPNVLVVRYERWFDDRERLLRDLGTFLGVPLGAGPARIGKPRPHASFSPREFDLIRAHCSTADALGYPLPGGAAARAFVG